MDELLIDRAAPRNQDLAAEFDPALTGGVRSGWHARVTPFEATPGASGVPLGSRPRGTRNLVDERADAPQLMRSKDFAATFCSQETGNSDASARPHIATSAASRCWN